MHAIVLCAGSGTRLRPLTSWLPKPALPLGDGPILLGTLRALAAAGFQEVHCNTHYLAQTLEEVVAQAVEDEFGQRLRVRFWREEGPILETGGGIVAIARGLQREAPSERHDLLVISGDIAGKVPATELLQAWEARAPGTTALLSTRALDTHRADPTLVDVRGGRVLGFPLRSGGTYGGIPRVFTNHQVIAYAAWSRVPLVHRSSIHLIYSLCLSRGERIAHFDFPSSWPWHNVGTAAEYAQAARHLGSLAGLPSLPQVLVYAHSQGARLVRHEGLGCVGTWPQNAPPCVDDVLEVMPQDTPAQLLDLSGSVVFWKRVPQKLPVPYLVDAAALGCGTNLGEVPSPFHFLITGT